MRVGPGFPSSRFLVPTVLFSLAALGSAQISSSQVNPDSNPYAVTGKQFLLQLQHAYLQSTPPANPAGFTTLLYTGDINPNTGKQQATKAALFAQENMIRALYWGTQVDSATFKPLLSAASVDRYPSAVTQYKAVACSGKSRTPPERKGTASGVRSGTFHRFGFIS